MEILKTSRKIIEHELRPYGVTGYFDAEGCFNITISPNHKLKSGFSVTFTAELKQHSNSVNMLLSVQKYFNGIGNITTNIKSNISRYKIGNINDINTYIIPHFDKYPLLSSKQLNFLDFKKAIELITRKDHLTIEGINNLKKILSKMNTNRSFLDKWNFLTNHLKNYESLPPEWIQSFSDGEGCFNFYYRDTKSKSISFSIGQNISDLTLLISIKNYFNKGNIYPLILDGSLEKTQEYLKQRFITESGSPVREKKSDLDSEILSLKSLELSRSIVIRFEITGMKNCKEAVIPFFKKYPLYTTKCLDFEDWCDLIELNEKKAYKTLDGKDKMINLSKGMNRGRKF